MRVKGSGAGHKKEINQQSQGTQNKEYIFNEAFD
jgi:hypothetical protein